MQEDIFHSADDDPEEFERRNVNVETLDQPDLLPMSGSERDHID